MTLSHCMDQALAIAQTARADWAAAIAKVPETCPRSDCTGGVGCRERIADYLRVQWRMAERREGRGGHGR